MPALELKHIGQSHGSVIEHSKTAKPKWQFMKIAEQVQPGCRVNFADSLPVELAAVFATPAEALVGASAVLNKVGIGQSGSPVKGR